MIRQAEGSSHNLVKGRLFRLTPGVVRALVPAHQIGSYVLYEGGLPLYVGRSDTCLQRRLLRHAYNERAPFFDFYLHYTPVHAYAMECATYHSMRPVLSNQIHPSVPAGSAALCPFCRANWVMNRTAPLSMSESQQ